MKFEFSGTFFPKNIIVINNSPKAHQAAEKEPKLGGNPAITQSTGTSLATDLVVTD